MFLFSDPFRLLSITGRRHKGRFAMRQGYRGRLSALTPARIQTLAYVHILWYNKQFKTSSRSD